MTQDATEYSAMDPAANSQDISVPSVFSVVAPGTSVGAPPFAGHLGYGQSAYAQPTYYPPIPVPLPSQSYHSQYVPYSPAPHVSPGYQGNYAPYGLPERLFAPSSPLAPIEDRLRSTLGALNNLVRAFGSVAHMLDSTFYAGWSSLMAVIAVAEQLKHLRKEHIAKWLGLAKSALHWLSRLVRGRHGQGAQVAKGPAEIVRSPSQAPSPTIYQKTFTHGVPILGMLITPFIAYAVYHLLRQVMRSSHPHHALARAQYPFQSVNSRCLALAPGDDLYVLSQGSAEDAGWILVQSVRTGQTGYVPLSYINLVESRQ